MGKELGIGYSPLTEKVYIGSQDKKKGMWVGDKKDVTQDFINIIFEYIPPGNSRSINQGEKKFVLCNIDIQNKDKIQKAITFFAKKLAELETINP